MRKLKDNNIGSVIPLIFFILTIFVCGALYTLFFVEVGFPSLEYLIPSSDAKTFIMMCIYGIPLIILIVGIAWLVREGVKREVMVG